MTRLCGKNNEHTDMSATFGSISRNVWLPTLPTYQSFIIHQPHPVYTLKNDFHIFYRLSKKRHETIDEDATITNA